MHADDTLESVNAGSPFSLLAESWLRDLRMDVDSADSTKALCERELRTLVRPAFEHVTVREVSVGRVEDSLRARASQTLKVAGHLILARSRRRVLI